MRQEIRVPVPPGLNGGIRYTWSVSFLKASILIFEARVRLAVKDPLWVFIGASQPVLYLVLFGPLASRVLPSNNGTAPLEQFVPGIICQLALLGSLSAGFSLIIDIRSGVMERVSVTPVHHFAPLAGRLMKDFVVLLLQALFVLVVAVIGFDLTVAILPFAVTLILAGIMATGLSAVSYSIAAWSPTEQSVASVVNTCAMPLVLLSGILLPTDIGPNWLQTIASWNPVWYTVDGARLAFAGDYSSHNFYRGVAVTILTAILFLSASLVSFRRATYNQ